MINIKKFENVFGIKKLIINSPFKKNNVIYAPNGTMKTSFSDALVNISNGESVNDAYGESPNASYEIDSDGTIFTENDNVRLPIIRYSGVEKCELSEDANYANLVISPKYRQQIIDILTNLEKASSRIKGIISNAFPKEYKKTSLEKSLREIVKPGDDDIYIKLLDCIDFDTSPYPFLVSETDFVNLVTSKVKKVSDKENVKTSAKTFVEYIGKKKEDTILDENFTLENLQIFYDTANKLNYFKDEVNPRLLSINDNLYNKEATHKLIIDETNKIYSSKDARDKFELVKKELGSAEKIKKILDEKKELVEILIDFDSSSQKMLITILKDYIEQLKNEKEYVRKQRQNYDELEKSITLEDTNIYNIWEKFKSRFRFEKFDLRIENKAIAVSGLKAPQFVKYLHNTDTPINDPKDFRFSTGEIRTYNLINAILNIESEKEKGKPFTLVLDDPVDSFDYKNKYSFIDYLVDISNDPNVQLIILTHNFDFFRTTKQALNHINCYLAYKNSSNEVNVELVNNKKFYFELCTFNSWKKDNNLLHYLAIIPFARNIIQLKSNSGEAAAIDRFLHYDLSIETDTFANLDDCMKEIKAELPADCPATNSYLAELRKKVIEIGEEVCETDLASKLVLALYIRIALERLLLLTIIENTHQIIEINVNHKTRDLIKNGSQYFSDECNGKILKANIICPSFVHVNSFMYEPLVDVSGYELIEIAKWLYSVNRDLDYDNILIGLENNQ